MKMPAIRSWQALCIRTVVALASAALPVATLLERYAAR
jgi:hypothetical protein